MDRRKVGARRPGRQELPDLDDVMYGVHAVEEALIAGEALRKIHVGNERRRDPIVRRLLERARELSITVRFEEPRFFTQFPYKAHQSMIAFGAPFPYVTLEEAIAGRRGTGQALYVVLDHITDPHNAGAIIRTAECAGADAVILPERRAAGVNATVRKAAAGAAAHIPIARVANIADAVRKLKKAGVWVAGADIGEGSVALSDADLARDVAIVIGAEGAGLSHLLKRECDYLVTIPMFGKIKSLNASVAAGVLLYEAIRQRRIPTPRLDCAGGASYTR
ncbi:MAG: 23S rRNA (guanosine(2251)-2'-O)-methyltransferase RlmB [Candidatus Eremiobacteraeota bacterium]|nr:23S rRNA (guanosine(2251)-2'-O)-methyltransferase RlmB [Candidatus Eremiobacteraeota bacterium]